MIVYESFFYEIIFEKFLKVSRIVSTNFRFDVLPDISTIERPMKFIALQLF